jgi:acetylornithine deacetylase
LASVEAGGIDLVRRIRPAVDATFDELLAAFREGVRIDSRNPADGGPGEAEFQRHYGGLLADAGATVETWTIDVDALVAAYPSVFAAAGKVDAQAMDGRPVVIGWLPSVEPADGRRAHVILNSHADTVGITDPGSWALPAHSAEVVEGELHGLGSLDAKGSLFTFLGATLALQRAGIRLTRPVMIQSVVDEEVTGAGTLECVRRGYTANAAIVGEPTDLAVCPGSRGKATLHLDVRGRSAHPGEGWRGVNAIRKAWQYVEALDALRDRLDRSAMHPLWAGLPAGHVWNLMAMNSGPLGRAVPSRCEIVYGIGTIGTERNGEMRPIVEEALAAVTAGDPWLTEHPPTLTWRGLAMEAAVSDPGHPAVEAMLDAGRRVTGQVPALTAASVATDGRHLVNAGGIPAINFGPGATRRAHSPGESVGLAQVREAITWLSCFLAAYCGIAGEPIGSLPDEPGH